MRIKPEDAIVVVVDYQEKLLPAMHKLDELMIQSKKLLAGLKELDIPMIVSQQYTKGLGPTPQELIDCMGDSYKPYEKDSFSVYTDDVIKDAIDKIGKKKIILCGTEAHVCVLQTLIDFREAGYDVYLVADCIASRSKHDKKLALKRAMGEGAYITSAEAILFELTLTSKSEHFRAISKIIK